MKKIGGIVLLCITFFVFVIPMRVAGQSGVAFPDVPRVSVFEAYEKYKSGRAIVIQAGGEVFERRHIAGAYVVDAEAISRGDAELPNYPMEGIEIFTYCY